MTEPRAGVTPSLLPSDTEARGWGDGMSGTVGVVSEATGTLRRAAEGVKITVDQDNILQAARIIETEAQLLQRVIDARANGMRVHPMGGDPVSGEVARVLTYKFRAAPDSYIERCREYAKMLHQLAAQLYESARTYGHGEDVISAELRAAAEMAGQRSLNLAPSPAARGNRGLSAV